MIPIKNKIVFLTLLTILRAPIKSCNIDIDKEAKKLSAQKTFTFFDPGLTLAEKEDLNDMQPRLMNSLTKMTPFDQKCDLKDFERCYENNIIFQKKFAPILQKICKNVAKSSNKKFYGRVASEHERSHDQFEWHIDNKSYACRNLDQTSTRILINVFGKGTQFTELDSQDRSQFIQCYCSDMYGKSDSTIASIRKLIPAHSIQQLQPGQAVLFKKGDQAIGAIHTRPDTQEPRALMVFDLHNNT